MLRHSLSRRDAFLVLLGASSMHLWSLMLRSVAPSSTEDFSAVTHLSQVNQLNQVNHVVETFTTTARYTATATVTQTAVQTQVVASSEGWNYEEIDKIAGGKSDPSDPLPQSRLVAHAPGWTLVRNLYMSNDTLYIITPESPVTPSRSDPGNSRDRKPDYYGPHGEDLTYGYTKVNGWPEVRQMTSTGLEAVNSPENIAIREPLPQNLQYITLEEARKRWGDAILKDEHGVERKESRVWVVQGNSLLFNDPSQFLRHYYHFVAELFFGVQAFWNSAFFPAVETSDSEFHFSTSHSGNPPPPPMHRAIFIHSNADGWRDNPGFNRYFLRAAYPSLTVEHQEDWQDRVKASVEGVAHGTSGERVWRFPMALLTDRSASHRGHMCGSLTQRTAAEAWDHMRKVGKLRGIHVGGWWAPIREAVWKFAGVSAHGGVLDGSQIAFSVDQTKVDGADKKATTTTTREPVDVGEEFQAALPMPSEVVITYISRQSARNRKLVKEDHEAMVEAVNELVKRKNEEREVVEARVKKAAALAAKKHGSAPKGGSTEEIPPPWSFDVLQAEHLTKDQQVQAAARTTILLGVHGNGLTHLVWMKPTKVSSVIEIFCPPGFAHDYWWTARSLGMRHWAMWNDTAKTWPEKPEVNYPDCFQKNAIPVHGPSVAKLIEDRVAGKL
ncbi:hypothetical protein EST38_g5493 [Candolleomyces aberdarensis]|uniref:Uncharacterized protein n=1 Tax=Candolleomyces aberdarensis TaxID=2316362 RepID=A0A4V1Q400_9AGAR|nr:hypothetical protein EST38_g5493 [Candolleomyces aberdarensis]